MNPIRLSRLESALRVVIAFHEAFNRHDVAGMMQLMSDDCLFENTGPAPDGAAYAGREAVAQFWHDFFAGSPHAHIDKALLCQRIGACKRNLAHSRTRGCSRSLAAHTHPL